jgi:pimeloyl-ACP methyl ester carboxylesterase
MDVGAPGRLVYCDAGSGPPLLLLHGMFGDHLDWAPVIEPLSNRFRVIAPDLPGFGGSDKPDAAYDHAFFIGAIRKLLDGLEVDRVTMVGNSFGGLLALLYTLDHPENVDRLVLVSSGGLQPLDAAALDRVNHFFTESSLTALTPDIQNTMFSPVFAASSTAKQAYLDKQNAKLGRPDMPAYARALARSIRFVAHTCCENRLHEIACPTLLLWGDRDIVLPPKIALQAAERIRNSRVKMLAGCGHAPQLDCPTGFTRAVEEFIGHFAVAV